MQFMNRYVIFVVALAFTAGCSTTSDKKRNRTTIITGNLDKPGQKSGEVPSGTPAIPAEEQIGFLVRHSEVSQTLTDRDREVIDLLPARQQPGSLPEAVLALGLVKTVLYPAGSNYPTQPPGFEESDLVSGSIAGTPGAVSQPPTSGQPSAADPTVVGGSSGPSLEALCREKNLDLPRIVETNLLLRSREIHAMTIAALDRGRNSRDFRDKVISAVKKQADSWNQLASRVAPPAQTTAQTETDPASPQTPSPGGDGATPAPATPGSDGKGDKDADAILADSQTLSEQGKYFEAIQAAKKVPKEHPRFPEAQDRIKKLSNVAVQDLRSKAAQSFQNSLPVSEPTSKRVYLERAKGFLEEALQKYPEADQLGTVKDNLSVISRDLDGIKN